MCVFEREGVFESKRVCVCLKEEIVCVCVFHLSLLSVYDYTLMLSEVVLPSKALR